jgi:hypothetical protein
MALPNPKGIAISPDMRAIMRVPATSGMTPNEGGSNTGAQRREVKNSTTDTMEKNSKVS